MFRETVLIIKCLNGTEYEYLFNVLKKWYAITVIEGYVESFNVYPAHIEFFPYSCTIELNVLRVNYSYDYTERHSLSYNEFISWLKEVDVFELIF